MDLFLEEYKKRNSSYQKKAIFFVGHSAGFFSEIFCMVGTLLYCDKKNIQFKLYSGRANFSRNNKGWQEFFLPFCTESHNSLVKTTRRSYKKYSLWTILSFRRPILRHAIVELLIKKISRVDYLTHEVILQNLQPLFSSSGELQDNLRDYATMVWRFNAETSHEVAKKIGRIKLPKEYLAIQIRRGDKLELEKHRTVDHDCYMLALQKVSSIENIFVFCDDYRDFQYFVHTYPDFQFYTLCKPYEFGYIHQEFISKPWSEQRGEYIKLFANIEILRGAEYTLGTLIANPSQFLNVIMPSERFSFVEEIMRGIHNQDTIQG